MKEYRIYCGDYARIYHENFTTAAEATANAVMKIIERFELKNAHIVDLGCGDGTCARLLTEAGCRVTGCDISPDMVAIARNQVPEAEFQVASSYDFDIPNCDIVLAVGGVLGHNPGFLDQKEHLVQLGILFQKVFGALSDQGIFVFDLSTANKLPQEGWLKYIVHSENWSFISNTTIDLAKCERQKEVCVYYRDSVETNFRRTIENHRFSIFETWQINKKLEIAGFETTRSSRIADYELVQGHQGFWARKPSKPESQVQTGHVP